MTTLRRIAEPDGLLADWGQNLGPVAYAVLAGLVFFQTAFVFGWLVPGNVFVFAVGLLSHPEAGIFGLGTAWPAMAAGAALGNLAGYALGRSAEPWLERLPGPLRLTPAAHERAHAFFERYGRAAVGAALFIPFVRSFVPTVAGVGGMAFPAFALSSVVGAAAWTGIFLGAGRWLGQVPFVRQYLGAVVLVVTLYAVAVVARGAWRGWRERRTRPAEA